jgi:hypothetical protein
MPADDQSRAETAAGDGAWVLPRISYVEPARRHCSLCGRPLARRYWRATVNGAAAMFCDPAHEALYHSYWLPVHGAPRPGQD